MDHQLSLLRRCNLAKSFTKLANSRRFQRWFPNRAREMQTSPVMVAKAIVLKTIECRTLVASYMAALFQRTKGAIDVSSSHLKTAIKVIHRWHLATIGPEVRNGAKAKICQYLISKQRPQTCGNRNIFRATDLPATRLLTIYFSASSLSQSQRH